MSGVVKAFSTEADGTEHIHAFLFADDLLGLSDEGRYVNSAEAVTPLTAYRLPTAKLQSHLRKDAGLEFHVICKLCQELRQAQRHAFLLSQRSALPKLAMFLQLLEDLQASRDEPVNEIHLPMDRTEIAEFVGMSLAAVSRRFKSSRPGHHRAAQPPARQDQGSRRLRRPGRSFRQPHEGARVQGRPVLWGLLATAAIGFPVHAQGADTAERTAAGTAGLRRCHAVQPEEARSPTAARSDLQGSGSDARHDPYGPERSRSPRRMRECRCSG